jgi:hypothetical protein
MIFLSAQPDSVYFTWQIEIQLMNFFHHKIDPRKIHVLFSFDPKVGINHRVLDLIENYWAYANFYTYPDTRVKKKYLSSIRPNIIKQHFKKYVFLQDEIIFYHDSDIVFTERLPDFERLCIDSTWYFSDTRSYLSASFIIRSAGRLAFNEMCAVMETDADLVIANNENSGGAQALIKRVGPEFWDRVETDCENLFDLLHNNQDRYQLDFQNTNKEPNVKFTPLVAWCADMWALLWNAIKVGNVKIDRDLDFCWPTNTTEHWKKQNIFHNAGITADMKNVFFYKSSFMDTDPFDFDLSHFKKNNCGQKYIEMIKVLGSKRYDIEDCSILITIRVEHNDRLENLKTILAFLKKHFIINIYLLEADDEQRVPRDVLDDSIHYIFIEDHDPLFKREYYSNYLARLATTKIVIKYDCDIIIPPAQFYSAVLMVRYGKAKICYPYDGAFINVAGVLRDHFIEYLNVGTLLKYVPKIKHPKPSYGGCVILDRKTFERLGYDNENFHGWGFEDQELHKRYKIMGEQISRVPGPLLHLNHYRSKNSNFFSSAEMFNSYNEYLKITDMTKNELTLEISAWKNRTAI